MAANSHFQKKYFQLTINLTIGFLPRQGPNAAFNWVTLLVKHTTYALFLCLKRSFRRNSRGQSGKIIIFWLFAKFTQQLKPVWRMLCLKASVRGKFTTLECPKKATEVQKVIEA